MNAWTITRLDATPLPLALTVPFGIAGGALAHADNVLVRIELQCGAFGIGEAAPFPLVTGETQAVTLAACARARAILCGRSARALRPLTTALDSAIGANAARCAIEAALLDAHTRALGLPMVQWFGGAGDHVETDMTLTTGDVAQARTATRAILARGVRVLKIKVGGGDPALDVARVAAVREIAPTAPLLLDGNCAFDRASALALLRELARRELRVDLFEQPLARADLDGMRMVQQEGCIDVAADESLRSPADALAIVAHDAARVLNIKLMKCGVFAAQDIAAIARAAGLDLMIGAMVESRLGTAVSAAFAAGIGGFRYVDLDTPWFLSADPFRGGYREEGAILRVLDDAGHGVAIAAP